MACSPSASSSSWSNCQIYFRQEHFAERCPQLSSFFHRRSHMDACQICFQRGYRAPNCYHLSHFFNSTKKLQPQALSAQSSLQPAYDPSWYPDTGASTHRTGDPILLQKRSPYSGLDRVQLGNGERL